MTDLRTNHLKSPLGIDTAAPTLSWTLKSDGYNQKQTEYRIQAAASLADLNAEAQLLWDSGRVASDRNTDILYEGKAALASRQRVYWRVQVWNGQTASAWSAPDFWEMGLLSPSDWTAQWIQRSPSPLATFTNTFSAPLAARYLRLSVYETGPVPTADPVYRLQIMELRVHNAAGANLATGATVTGSNAFTLAPQWGPTRLVDGDVNTGFSTNAYASAQHGVGAPAWVQLDLGQSRAGITSVQIVNRTAASAANTSTPNYPKRYQIQISDDGQQWTTAGYYLAGTGQTGYEALGAPQVIDVPAFSEASAPLFASHFQVDAAKSVARARLYISGLGLYYAEVNGKPVADSYFDPSESDYRRRIFYSTYDVTSLVQSGANAVGFQLGHGIYGNGVSPNGGRYEKSDGLPYGATGLHGTLKGIAQLEVTYADGTTTTVASKDAWRYADSPITFNTWFGGEDYDARRAAQVAGWSTAANTFTGWASAQAVPANELPSGALRGRPTPPMRIVETLAAPAVTQGQFPNGNGWVDVSHNGAGFQGIRFSKSLGTSPDYAGVSLQFYPAEIKTDTDVDQSSTRAGTAPVFDTYTFSGRETAGTTWNPRFVYHGFRYYKLVLNVPAGRAPTDYGFADKAAMLRDLMTDKLAFVGHIVRTDNAKTGSFTSSNRSLNLIHTIIDRSIASQMYSVFTDCPHIEKLGWMETSHLMFPSIAGTYDIRAWMSKIAQDAVDSQVTGASDQAAQGGGSLGGAGYPLAIAPAFQIINGLNMDPNWNGAVILTPWEHYQAYGDASVLRASYPAMQKYLQWLQTRYAPSYIVNDAQMGDWGQYQVTTPTPLVVTAAFYRMADVMAQTAKILADPASASAYASLAGTIKTNFNTQFFKPATSSYGTDTQASHAIPLFSGLVPDGQADKVLEGLATVTQNLKYTITTGEIALRQTISALTAYGRSDVLYKMALQPTQPGYRYIAETLGETTMIEYWNYRDQWGNMRSRNHAMLGHIQEWFTRGLAGIDKATPGYRNIVIKPYVPDNAAEPADSRTTSVEATLGSSFGTVASAWQLGADGSLTLSVTIPVGTTATVYVPALGGTQNTVFVSYESIQDHPVHGTVMNGYVEIKDVPSGRYTFKRRPT